LADNEQAAQRLRADLCNVVNTLAQLQEQERLAQRVDERSGTVNLAERRRLSQAILLFQDKRSDDLRQLSKLGTEFKQQRDCGSGR
jgi:hypothetical protein